MKTKNQNRFTSFALLARRITGLATIALLAFPCSIPPSVAADSGTATASASDAIRPFHIKVPEAALVDLRQRINATRWPDKETVPDHSQGVQLATMKELARYWATDYDWRKCEAKLNALPQFVTTIDGVDIHFIHVRSKNKNALPLIVTHGWPGSIIEQLKIIGPLTDPVAYGGRAEDSFDVVIPSMPGYGFSGKRDGPLCCCDQGPPGRIAPNNPPSLPVPPKHNDSCAG